MKSIFDFLNTAQIDARLHRDIINYEDNLEKLCIVGFFVLLFIFRGWIGYWLRFGMAFSVPDNKPIDIMQDPIQEKYTTDESKLKTFKYKSMINQNIVTIIPVAHYKISGKTVAYNRDFFFRDQFFDSAALYDIGIAWGLLSDKEFFEKYMKVYSQKVEMTGSRRLNWTYKSDINLSRSYITSHISHSHIIPANRNIMAALLKINVWDNVELEGDLVDMEYIDNKKDRLYIYHTSLSRFDEDDSARGNGACETIYLTKLKIGNKLYK